MWEEGRESGGLDECQQPFAHRLRQQHDGWIAGYGRWLEVGSPASISKRWLNYACLILNRPPPICTTPRAVCPSLHSHRWLLIILLVGLRVRHWAALFGIAPGGNLMQSRWMQPDPAGLDTAKERAVHAGENWQVACWLWIDYKQTKKTRSHLSNHAVSLAGMWPGHTKK